MSRRVSREHAMKLIFQFQLRNDDIEDQVEVFLAETENLSGDEKEYFLDIVRGVMANCKEIDGLIENCAKDWGLERMPKVDLAIMRLSIYEMRFRKDIPYNISINEAVELAKKYGGEQSKTFINGILGKVVAGMQASKEQ